MKIIGRQRLHDFTRKHADARAWIRGWIAEVEAANWKTPAELKARYPKASILRDDTYIFDIRGNNYRMQVKVRFEEAIVLIERLGTHAEYDKWT